MRFKDLSILARLYLILTGLVFFLIALGGWVRNLGAGLACPDWPLCFGKLLPHFDIQIFAEFFHRLVAGLVSLLFLGLFIYVLLDGTRRKFFLRLNTLALLLLMVQIVLGGLTVLNLLQHDVVTLHLSTGTLFFSVILITTARAIRFNNNLNPQALLDDRKREAPPLAWRLHAVAIAFLFMQIVLGGAVSSRMAGLACPDFPTCLGEWFPGLDGAVGFHFMHRVGAIFTFLAIGLYAVVAVVTVPVPRIQKQFAWLGSLLVLQVALGIGNVLMRLPWPMSVAHLAVAEALRGGGNPDFYHGTRHGPWS
jgi:cytochrome c oxidase assembly protein subunit 15